MKCIFQTGLVAAVALGLCSTACNPTEDVDSTDVRTSGYYALLAVRADEVDTEVTAQLRVGGSGVDTTVAKLDGADKLIATKDDDSRVMVKADSSVSAPYRAVFESRGGGPVTVAFERGPDDISAPESRVILPPPFDVRFVDIHPDADTPRGRDIAITWTNPTDGVMKWELKGTCIDEQFGTVADSGSYTIPARKLVKTFLRDNDTAADPFTSWLFRCDVELVFQRQSEGFVDGAYGEGGQFTSVQTRTLWFRSTPSDAELELLGVEDPSDGGVP